MRSRVLSVSLLLLGSGFCALVYQVAWFRLLRLIFGASTASTAAVTAIFMAGLGIGSRLLGPRADRSPNPLMLYARLEIGIAASAAATPFLVALVQSAYLGVGGTLALGPFLGRIAQLVMTALVLGIPTLLMGGTLPAAARAVETATDEDRRRLGLLYGANTVGAVLGALVTTLAALEILGIQTSLWSASLLNIAIAVLAGSIARRRSAEEPEDPLAELEGTEVPNTTPAVPTGLVLTAAALVGFVFFLLELVWYRMLAPILGGSSYTFGIILAMALLGIGAGGLTYGLRRSRRPPDITAFATTCALEALAVAVPFALGDRLALFAVVMRGLGAVGFGGLVTGWMLVTAIVILPAAFVAGYQFPLLVALLGRGREAIGRQVGFAYAANTAGAILGSLAGGFGLLPVLSAPGTWRLASVLLLLMSLACLVWSRSRRSVFAVVAAVATVICLIQEGPTAFWRHSPIGAGRIELPEDANTLKAAIHATRRTLTWEVDGRESSVAGMQGDDYTFVVNGKADGTALQDSPTQVMVSLLGSALHPEPKRALVIGLGTGSSAGWLAKVPSIEQVDVVEIEPAILRVAEDCAPVNESVLDSPKVRMIIGDGREVLRTIDGTYDLIVSEPSNPYRAGIASLFSHEFYVAVEERLNEGGILAQWLQGYEVDSRVVRSTYATLGSVFPAVESWQIDTSDLLLLARPREFVHDLDRLRRRLAEEPYRRALRTVWGVEGVEGLFAAYVASPDFARAVAESDRHWINHDDRPIIEFGFARNLGRFGLFSIQRLRALAEARKAHIPPGASGLSWRAVADARSAMQMVFGEATEPPGSEPQRSRAAARNAYGSGNLRLTCEEWGAEGPPPQQPIDRLMIAECTANLGDARALEMAATLQDERPVEAALIRARLARRNEDWEGATAEFEAAFETMRSHPWAFEGTVRRGLQMARTVADRSPEMAPRLFEALSHPFAIGLWGETQRQVLFDIARRTDFEGRCVAALAYAEPFVPWHGVFLRERARCYEATGHPLARAAFEDLRAWTVTEPFQLETGLLPTSEGDG